MALRGTISSESPEALQELAVYQFQEPGEAVHVTISHNENLGPALTLEEARQLRDALGAILRQHAA
jgi:hypothetical protein